jgi:hypothetical protein
MTNYGRHGADITGSLAVGMSTLMIVCPCPLMRDQSNSNDKHDVVEIDFWPTGSYVHDTGMCC